MDDRLEGGLLSPFDEATQELNVRESPDCSHGEEDAKVSDGCALHAVLPHAVPSVLLGLYPLTTGSSPNEYNFFLPAPETEN